MMMKQTLQGVLYKRNFNINGIGTGSWGESGCKGRIQFEPFNTVVTSVGVASSPAA